jgi:hypothetical protein
MAYSCELSKVPSGIIKGGKFVDELEELLQKDSVPRRWRCFIHTYLGHGWFTD